MFRLINIYSNFNDMLVDYVKELNKKVDDVKKLKDAPIDEE